MDFLFFKFLLFSLINLSSTSSKHIKHHNEVVCKDPDMDYLESLYYDYQLIYDKYQESLIIKKAFLNFNSKEDDEENFNVDHFIENTQCNKNFRNQTGLNQNSLCPWKFVVYSRKNKYPFYKTSAKCTCQECQSKKLSNHKCEPVFKTVPVIKKEGCGSDGYFKWTPSTEKIATACVCTNLSEYVPYHRRN